MGDIKGGVDTAVGVIERICLARLTDSDDEKDVRDLLRDILAQCRLVTKASDRIPVDLPSMVTLTDVRSAIKRLNTRYPSEVPFAIEMFADGSGSVHNVHGRRVVTFGNVDTCTDVDRLRMITAVANTL